MQNICHLLLPASHTLADQGCWQRRVSSCVTSKCAPPLLQSPEPAIVQYNTTDVHIQAPSQRVCTPADLRFSETGLFNMARMQLSDDSEGEQGCSGIEASNLVFLGTYTDYDVLPHWPKGNKWGEGITVCRWQEEGKLQVVGMTPCLNPAFMK